MKFSDIWVTLLFILCVVIGAILDGSYGFNDINNSYIEVKNDKDY